MDPAFFVYYDECDFAKRLADAGWHSLFVPAAEAVHHDQLSTDLAAGLPRIVEFHRNRDLYMRKHHGRAAALAVRAPHRLVLRAARARRDRPPRPAGPRSTGPTPARRSSPTAAKPPRPRRADEIQVAAMTQRTWRAGTSEAGVLVHALGLVDLRDAGRRRPPGCGAQALEARRRARRGGAGGPSQRALARR